MTLLLHGCCPIFFGIHYPWECALLVFSSFLKGVHPKRAISSEQWTHELLKHEKFHSIRLSSIENELLKCRFIPSLVFADPIQKETLLLAYAYEKKLFCIKYQIFVFEIYLQYYILLTLQKYTFDQYWKSIMYFSKLIFKAINNKYTKPNLDNHNIKLEAKRIRTNWKMLLTTGIIWHGIPTPQLSLFLQTIQGGKFD